FPFAYPFILLSNYITYLKNLNRKSAYDDEFRKKVYKEIFLLSIKPSLLLDSHLFIEFEKETDSEEVSASLKSVYHEFGLT
ncbi:MAG TPA: hypothetical protein VII99_13955, partial [Bacteroidia bacterium]